MIQEHDIFSSMKTTNDFSFKGALQITDNLLILFVKLDFIIIIIIVFIQSKDKNTYPKLQWKCIKRYTIKYNSNIR